MISKYEILKEQINYAIQNSSLDVGAAYFIVKDILNNLEHLYYAQINKECDEMKNKSKKENKDLNIDENELIIK